MRIKIFIFFLLVFSVQCHALADSNFKTKECNNVHLHINKTVFFSGESVAFRAYVLDHSNQKIVLQKRNIIVRLFNHEGESIASKVVSYDLLGGFNSIELKESIESGVYFLNASLESKNGDNCGKSFIQEIKIFGNSSNPPLIDCTKQFYELNLLPNSKDLIALFLNNIYFQVNSNISIPSIESKVELYENDGKLIAETKTNNFGIGKISFIPQKLSKYYLKAELKDTTLIKFLPKITNSNFSLNINQNPLKEYFTVSVKANSELNKVITDSLTLVIHNSKAEYKETFSFDEVESSKELLLSNKNFPYGIISVSIVKNSKKIINKSFFNHSNQPPPKFSIKQTHYDTDTVSFNIQNADSLVNHFSISILPIKSKAVSNRKSLPYSLYLNNRLSIEYLPPEFYNFNFNHKSRYELDFLIQEFNDENKQIEYCYGFNIVGFINDKKLANKNNNVLLQSLGDGIFSSTKLNNENGFYFSGLKLYKDKRVHLSIINENGQLTDSKSNFHFNVQHAGKTNDIKNLSKKYYFRNKELSKYFNYSPLITNDVSGLIELNEVVVSTNKLKYEKYISGLYYGRQIDSTHNGYATLGNFLSTYGYQRTYIAPTSQSLPGQDGWVFVKRKADGSVLYPNIILDGISPTNLDAILDTPIASIDEVYFNRNGRYDPGTFIVFSKIASTTQSSQLGYYELDDGFDVIKKYNVPFYSSYDNEFFNDLGIFYWNPNLVVNENGIVSFKFAHFGHKKFRFIIEGFNSDGEITYWDSSVGNGVELQ